MNSAGSVLLDGAFGCPGGERRNVSPTETTDAAKADAKKLDRKKPDATKTDSTNNKDIKREISVEIPAAEVARETDLQIQRYQKSARLPGFRAGHVPASIIKQRFGDGLKNDVIEALIPKYFRREAEKQGSDSGIAAAGYRSAHA